MKIIILLCLLLNPSVWAITNGKPDFLNMNVGALVVETTVLDNETGLPLIIPICTLNLIHEKAVLTANHCKEGLIDFISIGFVNRFGISFEQNIEALNSSYEWFDTHVSSGKIIEFQLPYFISHYNLGPITNHYKNDLAMIVLNEAIEGIDPISLPSVGMLDNQVLKPHLTSYVVSGYGADIESTGKPLDEYRDQRESTYTKHQSLKDDFVQTTQVTSKGVNSAGTCYGDSGGALLYNGTLVGITSSGDKNCRAFGRYQRIDTQENLDWIYSIINYL